MLSILEDHVCPDIPELLPYHGAVPCEWDTVVLSVSCASVHGFTFCCTDADIYAHVNVVLYSANVII